MKKSKVAVLTAMIVGLSASVSSAASVQLYDWNFYVDGDRYYALNHDELPAAGSFDEETGLGTLTWTTGAAGSHTFLAMFDHEIDQASNTFFNEFGSAGGPPADGQSWEIDEPGFMFGDIYDNVLEGVLDNTNGVSAGSEDDVSMALGWDFYLEDDQTAEITLNLMLLSLHDALPASGFYLQQVDPESNCAIYFYSSLTVSDHAPVPEPATMLLFGPALAGLFGYIRRKKIHK